MAEDPVNQQKFAEDVAAAEAAGSGGPFSEHDGGFEMPSPEKIWELIQSMEMSDEERASLRESLFNPPQDAEDFRKAFAPPTIAPSSRDYTIFFVMVAIVVLVFALFGYKLYRSLAERELKKQEKLKNKQSKKAKKLN